MGKYLKEKNPTVKIYAAEPQNSPVLSGGKSGPHKIQGIGAGFVPATFDSSVCDGFISISYQCAKSAVKSLAKTEGILAGISSGAALCAAELVAQRPENKGKIIVTLFPDGGERYLSTDLFD